VQQLRRQGDIDPARLAHGAAARLSTAPLAYELFRTLFVVPEVIPSENDQMTNETLAHYMLATQDADYGLVTADAAQARAQELANEEGKVVYLRHPETDKVLGKAKPVKAAKL
jgi:hypothetical protein